MKNKQLVIKCEIRIGCLNPNDGLLKQATTKEFDIEELFARALDEGTLDFPKDNIAIIDCDCEVE